jgi:hypothetical protein
LAIYSIPTRGFTAVVSVFEGTPPAKPIKLNCKFRFRAVVVAAGGAWAHHAGDTFNRVFAKISLSPEDITWMSRFSGSQILRLTLTAIHTVSSAGKTKNPAYVSVSRVGRNYFESLPAYAWSVPINFRLLRGIRHGQTEAEHAASNRPIMTGHLRGRHRGPTRGGYVRASFHQRKTNSIALRRLQQIFSRKHKIS